MIAICINENSYHITVGKIYDLEVAQHSGIFDWWVLNDRGHRHLIEDCVFISLEEFRNLKIDSILIE